MLLKFLPNYFSRICWLLLLSCGSGALFNESFMVKLLVTFFLIFLKYVKAPLALVFFSTLFCSSIEMLEPSLSSAFPAEPPFCNSSLCSSSSLWILDGDIISIVLLLIWNRDEFISPPIFTKFSLRFLLCWLGFRFGCPCRLLELIGCWSEPVGSWAAWSFLSFLLCLSLFLDCSYLLDIGGSSSSWSPLCWSCLYTSIN